MLNHRSLNQVPLAIAALWSVAAVVIGCDSHERSDSPVRGELLYLATRQRGLDEPALCVLELSSRAVTVLEADGRRIVPFTLGCPPRWNKEPDRLCFCSGLPSPGLLELEMRSGELEQKLPLGSFSYPGLFGTIDVGETPGVELSHQGLEYGELSGSMFVLRSYELHRDLPVPPMYDSTDIPRWMKDRIHQAVSEHREKWVDLIRLDDSGKVSLTRIEEWTLYRGFSISPDERFFAYSSEEEVNIFDAITGDILIPSLPVNTVPGNLAFSPDGSALAVEVTIPRESSAIFLIPVPGFTTGEVIESTRRRGISRIAWSPDGKWIMLGVMSRIDLGVLDLVAIELESGHEYAIPQPYLVNGKEDKRYHVADGIEWAN